MGHISTINGSKHELVPIHDEDIVRHAVIRYKESRRSYIVVFREDDEVVVRNARCLDSLEALSAEEVCKDYWLAVPVQAE